jgi:hypothetical protein
MNESSAENKKDDDKDGRTVCDFLDGISSEQSKISNYLTPRWRIPQLAPRSPPWLSLESRLRVGSIRTGFVFLRRDSAYQIDAEFRVMALPVKERKGA